MDLLGCKRILLCKLPEPEFTVPCQQKKNMQCIIHSTTAIIKNAVHLTHGKAVLHTPFQGISQVHADE